MEGDCELGTFAFVENQNHWKGDKVWVRHGRRSWTGCRFGQEHEGRELGEGMACGYWTRDGGGKGGGSLADIQIRFEKAVLGNRCNCFSISKEQKDCD